MDDKTQVLNTEEREETTRMLTEGLGEEVTQMMADNTGGEVTLASEAEPKQMERTKNGNRNICSFPWLPREWLYSKMVHY